MVYALDTNIVIHLLQKDPDVCQKFNNIAVSDDFLTLPPFVHYEIRRGLLYKSASAKEKAYKKLIGICPVGEMSIAVLDCAAKLYADARRAGFTVEDADLLIAAFCVENGYVLVTDNVKHFQSIPNLKFENWVKH